MLLTLNDVDPVLRVDHATKLYGKDVGVRDVTFNAHAGEVLGLLGPNGSGKTTLLRMMLGLLHITSGNIALFGVDVGRASPEVRSRIGYLPGDLTLYDEQTVRQYLKFIGSLRRVDVEEAAGAMCGRLHLDLDRRIGDLSRGTKQKVALVQAFMHEPSLLLLDEPTSGLDPLVQREFDSLIDETRLRGATVILSSHILADVERLADRVAIMHAGRLVAIDDVAALKARFARRIEFEFPEPVDIELFTRLEGVTDVQTRGRRIVCSVTGPETDVLRTAVSLNVTSIRTRDPGLDEVFARIIEAPHGEA
jgi:ABC-2 type transport system ATP-binding protein